jgi:hypothetical protein
MADKKISQLTTLAQADVVANTDLLAIVDVSQTETKKATPEAVVLATLAQSTATILNVDNLRLDQNTISSTNTNGNIILAPNGTGDVYVDADTLRVGDVNATATVTTNGTGNLTISTNNGTNSGTFVINQGTNGNIAITPNGTGEVDISKVDIDGGTIDATTIGATTRAAGNFTTLDANGNVTLGDATSDTITATGRFNTDLVPSTDNARDLGTSALKWKQIYATTFTEGTFPVVTQTDVGTAPNQIPLNQYLGSMAYLDADNISFSARGTNTAEQNLAVNKLTTVVISADTTLTTTVPKVGSTAFVIVITSGASSRTVTFGTGFKSTGTLATGTDADRRFVFQFISDGTNLVEVSRTTAITY